MSWIPFVFGVVTTAALLGAVSVPENGAEREDRALGGELSLAPAEGAVEEGRR